MQMPVSQAINPLAPQDKLMMDGSVSLRLLRMHLLINPLLFLHRWPAAWDSCSFSSVACKCHFDIASSTWPVSWVRLWLSGQNKWLPWNLGAVMEGSWNADNIVLGLSAQPQDTLQGRVRYERAQPQPHQPAPILGPRISLLASPVSKVWTGQGISEWVNVAIRSCWLSG